MMFGGSPDVTVGVVGADGDTPTDTVASRRRWYKIAGSTLAAFGFSASLTMVNVGFRSVEKTSGGFCASGGPYVIAHHCTSSQTVQLFGGIGGLLVFGAFFAGLTAWADGPALSPSGLMWAALFISLGVEFLLVGGATGLFIGIMFIGMGSVGLYPPISYGWGWIRRGGEPEPDTPAFGGMGIVKAAVPAPVTNAAPSLAQTETKPVVPKRLVIPAKDKP